jgi:molybdopterin molybdotransferase
MIEESEARRRILEAIRPPGGSEKLGLVESCGRLSAREMIATVDLPGFDNSAMDGFAVRSSEARAGSVLRVSGEQAAGIDLGLSLGAGEAIRIFTGAPIPGGVDAVVMQEDTQFSADGATVEILDSPEPGEWLRRRGSDVCSGQRILEAGSPISPAVVGLLASQGVAEWEVRKLPRIGIVTTGDEVVEPGVALTPGHLYNSNGPMLEALVRQAGAVPVRHHAPDDPAALGRVLGKALAEADLVVIAGGVSVGGRDFVKDCLAGLGMTSDFWRVRVKPGKPFLFGYREGGDGQNSYVFGLPGNPVSAFVTWHLFVGPAIARWVGREVVDGLVLPRFHAVAGRRLENPGDRPNYARMRLEPGTGRLVPAGLQRSDALFGLSQARALLRLEAGQTIEPGETVEAWSL